MIMNPQAVKGSLMKNFSKNICKLKIQNFFGYQDNIVKFWLGQYFALFAHDDITEN